MLFVQKDHLRFPVRQMPKLLQSFSVMRSGSLARTFVKTLRKKLVVRNKFRRSTLLNQKFPRQAIVAEILSLMDSHYEYL